MGLAVEAYNRATARLASTKRDLRFNQQALGVARASLLHAQKMLAARMVAVYTNAEDQSTLSVILGATSLNDMVNRLEAVHTISRQDAQVILEVRTAKAQIARHNRLLVHARAVQTQAVATRAAEKVRIERQLAERQTLLASIKGQIAHIQAMEHARQLALAAQVRARLATRPAVQQPISGLGVAASTPEASVAPPSQYGGAVGIAMKYLGTPYVWGGSSPSGFDCSGFTMYVYAQMGVNLPHYTGAQWNVGVPVAQSDLQPGDLVFFNGLGHEGLYIGGGQFIHAPHSGDVVKISSLSDSWYAATYMGARRVTG